MRTISVIARLAAAVVILIAASQPRAMAQPAPEVRAFATPEEATRALVEAIRAESLDQLIALVGRPMLDAIPPEERQNARQRIETGRRLARERIAIEYTNERRTQARIVVGEQRFPLALPLTRGARGWTFDGTAAITEMLQRRIATNELNATRAMHAFARAQVSYAQQDWDGDGVLEFAQRLRSTEGARDGLYWRESIAGLTSSFINEAFVDAEAAPGAAPARASAGYAFRVLTGQGENAPGRAMSYIINGSMVVGYAIIAWPVRFGETGRSTFIMNQSGVVYEREFGEDTPRAVAAITTYDPGPGWTVVEDDDDAN